MFTTNDLSNPPVKACFKQLKDELFNLKRISVYLLEYDHGPVALMGNKWHKLKYNLLEASKLEKTTLLTFGGAFSNHIAATACAAGHYNFNSIGIIRGEETLPLNKTIKEAIANGMQIIYENRTIYRSKENPEYIAELRNRFGDFYLIPEGGSNLPAVTGCKEIPAEIKIPFDYFCCACGTGATIAGISEGLKDNQQVVGISVLKGNGFLKDKINSLIGENREHLSNWQIIEDYHFGGYAKSTDELEIFVRSFYENQNIRIEPVYTGKLFYGIYDLIKKDFFKAGSTVVIFHSGGLQYLEE